MRGATTDPIAKAVQDALIAATKARQASVHAGELAAVRDMLSKGTSSIAQIVRATGVQRATVYRLRADSAAAEAGARRFHMPGLSERASSTDEASNPCPLIKVD